jgi:hypothetical protein
VNRGGAAALRADRLGLIVSHGLIVRIRLRRGKRRRSASDGQMWREMPREPEMVT